MQEFYKNTIFFLCEFLNKFFQNILARFCRISDMIQHGSLAGYVKDSARILAKMFVG